MRDAIKEIIGKTVHSVVVSENIRPPRSQVFLVFEDETAYELYGDITGASALDTGGEAAAVEYARKFEGKVQVFSLRKSKSFRPGG